MSLSLLGQHAAQALVCFGGAGARHGAELSALSQEVAEALPPADSGPVLLACRDRYFFMAGLLGALRRGHALVLPHNGQLETVRALSKAQKVSCLVHDVPGEEGLDVSTLAPAAGLPSAGPLPGSVLELPVVLFTSGSTGQPVAQRKLWRQLLAEAAAHAQDFQLAGHRVVAGVPPYHIYGLLFSVLAPLLSGGSVLRSTPLFPRELCAELRAHQADVLVSVPPQLVAMSEDRELALPAMWRVFSSAGPLPATAHAALLERGVSVTEILGSTETGGIAWRDRPAASWRPLPGVRVSLVDDALLCVDAPWLADHQPRPLRTADRAELTPQGFRHLGRADAVTKIGGRRVDLGDVEAALRSLPQVRDARVLPVDAGGVRGLTLWAVVESDLDVSAATLRAALSRFDPVTHPKRFRCVRALPRSETGKLTRAALLALFDSWELPFESLAEGTVRVDVPRNTGFVRGHFEGDPILPGVVQLKHIALAEVRRRYGDLGAVARVTRVKFKRVVLPGEQLTVSVSRKGPLQVQFSMQVGSEPACSGIFHFRESKADSHTLPAAGSSPGEV